MKRVLLAAGMALALGAAPIAAQTRVSVAVGFAVPRPYAAAVVVVGRPRLRLLYRVPVFVTRRTPVAGYRHHHRHHCAYDYDDD